MSETNTSPNILWREGEVVSTGYCILCVENISTDQDITIRLPCGHIFHYNCFVNVTKPVCPFCRQPIIVNVTIEPIVSLSTPTVNFVPRAVPTPPIRRGPRPGRRTHRREREMESLQNLASLIQLNTDWSNPTTFEMDH